MPLVSRIRSPVFGTEYGGTAVQDIIVTYVGFDGGDGKIGSSMPACRVNVHRDSILFACIEDRSCCINRSSSDTANSISI